MHQLLVVDPKWVEEAHDSLKQRLYDKMSSAADVIKKFKRQSEYKFLKQCHQNAWTQPVLGDILSGKSTITSTGKESLFSFLNFLSICVVCTQQCVQVLFIW